MTSRLSALSAFAVGVAFAVGLGISGMTMPAKVIGFLDFFGHWDPSLMFVMGGAVVMYTVSFRVLRGTAPLLAEHFSLPIRKQIDRRLIGGSVLFGVGWGLAGYCPGPALTSVGAQAADATVVALSMLGGMIIYRLTRR